MDGNSQSMEVMSNIDLKRYLYMTTSGINDSKLYLSEMKSIFGNKFNKPNFILDKYIEPSRSVYIRGYIDVLFESESISEIVKNIENANLSYEKYKIKFIKSDEKIEYSEWITALKDLGTSIIGEFSLHNPETELALIRNDNLWVFGLHYRNKDKWKNRRQKPYNYSHALDVKLAKSILNIAIKNDFSLKIIDPCCGIGTVVIEALAMGLDIEGYDINKVVVDHANSNLEHLGFKGIIKNMNMHDINKKYDIAVLDIPYGQFTSTTHEVQILLISKTRQISKKAIIISMIDMSEDIIHSGFTIVDKIILNKTNGFSRYITVCNWIGVNFMFSPFFMFKIYQMLKKRMSGLWSIIKGVIISI